ncbi:MAG TPA: cupin domain-containing protein [Terriglobales bacterium]|nr:cupin domain-containing protein [Terriglobales bacterium]
MRFAVCCFLSAVFAMGLALQNAAAEDKMVYASKASSKFVNLPGLPTCITASVQSGDPSKGPSVILAKFPTGCIVPWHWHTADEQLMIVSGTGKVAMKDGQPTSVHSGDYVNLPGKNVHQFTCMAACTFFIAPSAAFDIHYVDKSGKEISPDEAFKSNSKMPSKKGMKKDTRM